MIFLYFVFVIVCRVSIF